MPERIIDNIMVIQCATVLGAPIGFDNWMRERPQPLPLFGEYDGKVLRELGHSADDITALRNEMITNAAG